MTVRLYEIEPGVWIVPELVTSIVVNPVYNGVGYEGFSVLINMVGGNTVAVRAFSNFGKGPGERVNVHTADAWRDYGQQAAREVAAWIDERRVDPLQVVRA